MSPRIVGSVIAMTLTAIAATAFADGETEAAPKAAEAKVEAKPEAKAEAKAEAKPEAKAEAKAAPRPAATQAPARTPTPEPSEAKAAEPATEVAEAKVEAPAPEGTPLAVRSTHAMSLAPAPSGTPFGYKLLFGLLLAAGAFAWMRKRRASRMPRSPGARVDVLARTSVGVRSDLLVVEVDGTRLLVGMTPSAIQTLAVLDARPIEEADAAPEQEEEPVPVVPMTTPVFDRVRALLGPRGRGEGAEGPRGRGAEGSDEPVDIIERVTKDRFEPKNASARLRRVSTMPPAEKPTKAPPSKTKAPARRSTSPRAIAGQAKGLLLSFEEER